METEIITAIISLVGGIIGGKITYWYDKRKWIRSSQLELHLKRLEELKIRLNKLYTICRDYLNKTTISKEDIFYYELYCDNCIRNKINEYLINPHANKSEIVEDVKTYFIEKIQFYENNINNILDVK